MHIGYLIRPYRLSDPSISNGADLNKVYSVRYEQAL